MDNKSSIQTKILLSIASVFMLLMAASIIFMADRQKEMVQALAGEKAHDIANTYFDGVNTMMLTNSMSQSELLRQKTLSHPNVADIRLIRGKGIVDFYGAGKAEQSPIDELDRKALNGESIVQPGEDSKGRLITVIEPILASSNFRGTNCLTCHPVENGNVLGAVRVTYSLANLDAEINRDLAMTGAMTAGLFLIGMLLITLLMKKIVVKNQSTFIKNFEQTLIIHYCFIFKQNKEYV